MEKEMNILDLCKAFVRGIIRGIKRIANLLANMLRISYRHWIIASVCIVLTCAASLYYTRPSNRKYRVNAIVSLNGPSVQEVKTRYMALGQAFAEKDMKSQSLSQMLGISQQEAKALSHFRTYYVIDCLNDGTADYVDYGDKNDGTDTVCVRMTDQLALQFYTKALNDIPTIEEKIMDYLNQDEHFVTEFVLNRNNRQRQADFDRAQVERLDSLTSHFYKEEMGQQMQSNAWNLTMGRKEIVLFLDKIEEHFEHKSTRDSRYALCTAPVVLQNHFTVNSKAVNGWLKFLIFAILTGWITGCLIGLIIEEKQKISAFLAK